MKTFKICGVDVHVKEVNMDVLNLYKDEPDEELWAYYDEMNYTIFIYEDLCAKAFKRTLIHEIIHAILAIAGVSCILKLDKEEAVCTAMENMLDLFLDKSFLTYLEDN